MKEQEALHLETDVRVDDDSESIEDAGSRRLQIAIFDDEAVLENAGHHLDPHPNHVIGRQLADDTRADEFVTGNHLSATGLLGGATLIMTSSDKSRASRNSLSAKNALFTSRGGPSSHCGGCFRSTASTGKTSHCGGRRQSGTEF